MTASMITAKRKGDPQHYVVGEKQHIYIYIYIYGGRRFVGGVRNTYKSAFILTLVHYTMGALRDIYMYIYKYINEINKRHIYIYIIVYICINWYEYIYVYIYITDIVQMKKYFLSKRCASVH